MLLNWNAPESLVSMGEFQKLWYLNYHEALAIRLSENLRQHFSAEGCEFLKYSHLIADFQDL